MRQPTLRDLSLAGRLVRLRPLRREDAALTFAMIHERREVLDWLIWQGPRSVHELAQDYSRWYLAGADADNYRFAVEELGGAVVGTMSLRFVDHPGTGNIGYWFGSEHWGRGLASEAIRLVVYLAFRHLRARAMSAEVFMGNEASCRVLAKNAFERQPQTTHCEVPVAGSRTRTERREEWVYRLTRERFDAQLSEFRPSDERVELA